MTTVVSPVRRTEPATVPGRPPGRWKPRPRPATAVSTSDIRVPDTRRAYADVLLARLDEMAPGDPGRVAARARVIEWHLPLAVYLARRYGGRGEPLADLTQVAAIGLIKAIDRYDQTRGVPFAGYAIPTIVGELKRYFRDTGWTVRAPRRLQELGPRLILAVEELAQVLHRSPTTVELAVRLGVSRDEVVEAQRCANALPAAVVRTAGAWRRGPAAVRRARRARSWARRGRAARNVASGSCHAARTGTAGHRLAVRR